MHGYSQPQGHAEHEAGTACFILHVDVVSRYCCEVRAIRAFPVRSREASIIIDHRFQLIALPNLVISANIRHDRRRNVQNNP